MMRLCSTMLLLAALGGRLAAQDTTKHPDTGAAKPAAAAPAAPAAGLAADAVVTRGLNGHDPQDTLTTVPTDVGQLYLWSRISGASGQAIHHVWFHGDTQVADVTLQVGGSPWRTWSRKTIPADWTGAWHVEVRDANGAVLKRIDFTVGS